MRMGPTIRPNQAARAEFHILGGVRWAAPVFLSVLYSVDVALTPHFLFIYLFCDRVLLCYPGWPGTGDPPLASQIAGMTSVCHHAWLSTSVLIFVLTPRVNLLVLDVLF